MTRFLRLFPFAGFLFLVAGKAMAVCPICTIAVGVGLGISERLGIDDSVAGLWIGGLTVSMAMWNIDWFNRKNIHFFLRDFLTVLGYFILVVLPLPYFFSDIIGNPGHVLWGVDKLMLGIVVGSIAFYLGADWYRRIKAKRGRAHFPFEKVTMPVLPLILLSVFFYFVTL
ncbi:MAG: hypothetical protein Q7S29_03460 [Candidatus Peribacter sp.]|nr:hypothetical protein [Candidatus Peribacter sp.]